MVTNEPGAPAPAKTAARILGERGEDTVAAWYLRAGYQILDRNWRCREGELDIVAGDDQTIVFCEVKSRATDRFVDPALAVDRRKQQRLRRAALRWLELQPWRRRLRFDVALVISGRIRIIEDAF